MKKKCVSSIGGQAVLDGVMMRGRGAMAIAVRAADGSIMVESERLKTTPAQKVISKIPVVRGIVNFAKSLAVGMRTTTRSTEVFGMDDEEPTKFEKWLAKTFKIDIMDVVTFVGIVLGVILSIGLFVIIPNLIAWGVFQIPGLPDIQSPFVKNIGAEGYSFWQNFGYNVLYNVISGFMRVLIFVGYIALISKMKDIHRLFMYHGAEHKTITCFEHGLELNPKNAQQFTTAHDRCGTTFMFIVMIVSILFFTVLPVDMLVPVQGAVLQVVVRVLIRLALIPVVAGVSYEFLKWFAKYDNLFARACKKPGLLLQKLTTREPEDDMIEVAIAAFNEVMELEADPARPTRKFEFFTTPERIVKKMELTLESKEEAELIAMFVSGAKNRTELYDGRRITKDQQDRAYAYADRCRKGMPIQYVLGTACFYGYDFVCDQRALIPRQDTERLVEEAIKEIKARENAEVLDICTGSGIVAITVKKETNATVTASDISSDALQLAGINASRLNADITFKQGSFFTPHRGKKFDVITANPPYIPGGQIAELDKKVKDYEPRLALDGGPDGLDAYRDVCAQAKDYLKEGGVLLLEVGVGQAEKVAEMLPEYDVRFVFDYNDPPIKRVVVAKLKTDNKEE